MKTFLIALRALVYMTGFVLLWGWVALTVRSFDPRFAVVWPAWTQGLGILFMGAGGTLALLCASLFIVQGRGTPALFDAPRAFVVVGPYRYVRNPMYIGGWMVLIGLGLYLQSIAILVLSLVLDFGSFLSCKD